MRDAIFGHYFTLALLTEAMDVDGCVVHSSAFQAFGTLGLHSNFFYLNAAIAMVPIIGVLHQQLLAALIIAHSLVSKVLGGLS